MPRLFAYGTLMDAAVMHRVCGLSPAGVPARVKNHRRLCVKGEHYPGMVRGQGGVVDGLVYSIPSHLWLQLDDFEGEQYLRRPVTVWFEDGRRTLAHAYIFRPGCRRLLSREAWDFEAFLRNGKQAFIDGYLKAHIPES